MIIHMGSSAHLLASIWSYAMLMEQMALIVQTIFNLYLRHQFAPLMVMQENLSCQSSNQAHMCPWRLSNIVIACITLFWFAEFIDWTLNCDKILIGQIQLDELLWYYQNHLLKTITIIIKAGRYCIIKITNEMAIFLLLILITMRIVWGPSLGR